LIEHGFTSAPTQLTGGRTVTIMYLLPRWRAAVKIIANLRRCSNRCCENHQRWAKSVFIL